MDLHGRSSRRIRHGPPRRDRPYSRQGMATRWRDERALVRSAQGGSPAAFEELFRLHWSRAHRAAYLVVHDAAAAEDIAQESFLAAVRNLDRFDRRRPFAPWLHRIVVNRAIDHARARALRAETGLEPDLPAAGQARPGRRPRSRCSRRSDACLPSSGRSIVLRHLLEYTPGEIADMLGIPRGTVNSRLRRGLDAIREVGREALSSSASRSPARRTPRSARHASSPPAFAERQPAARAAPCRVARSSRRGRGDRHRRRRPQPAGPGLRRRRPPRRRHRGRGARTLLAARAGTAARARRQRRLGREERRVTPAARGLRRGIVVAVRPLRRRRHGQRARDARSRGRRALDARPPRRPAPALGRHRDRHANRLPERRPAARRRGRRHRTTRRPASGRRAEVAPAWRAGLGFVLALRRHERARRRAPAREGRAAVDVGRRRDAALARVVERRPSSCSSSLPAGSRSSTRTAGAGSAGEAAADVVAAAYRPGTHAFAELHRRRRREQDHARREDALQLRRRAARADVVAGRPLAAHRRPAGRPVGVRPRGRPRIVAVSNVSRAVPLARRSRVSRAGAARRIEPCSSPARPIPDVPVWPALREEPVGLRQVLGRRGIGSPLLLRLRLVGRLNERDAAPA